MGKRSSGTRAPVDQQLQAKRVRYVPQRQSGTVPPLCNQYRLVDWSVLLEGLCATLPHLSEWLQSLNEKRPALNNLFSVLSGINKNSALPSKVIRDILDEIKEKTPQWAKNLRLPRPGITLAVFWEEFPLFIVEKTTKTIKHISGVEVCLPEMFAAWDLQLQGGSEFHSVRLGNARIYIKMADLFGQDLLRAPFFRHTMIWLGDPCEHPMDSHTEVPKGQQGRQAPPTMPRAEEHTEVTEADNSIEMHAECGSFVEGVGTLTRFVVEDLLRAAYSAGERAAHANIADPSKSEPGWAEVQEALNSATWPMSRDVGMHVAPAEDSQVEMHAEAGHYQQEAGTGCRFVDEDALHAASVALAEGQDGAGRLLANADGSSSD
jgi:hypothetical protein